MASCTAALSQALAVRDAAALDRCLSVQENVVITDSVAKLSGIQASALLDVLVERLRLQPQQASRLVPWLRSLLLGHGAALAASPASQAMLQLTNGILQERTACFSSMLSLSGRLQVLQTVGGGSIQSKTGGAQVVFSA